MSTTTTKERPILFSAPMVRAILEGRKTQTRRVVRPQPEINAVGDVGFTWATFFASGEVHTWDRRGIGGENWNPADHAGENKYSEALRRTPYPNPCPYGQPGDRLWVREAWRPRISKHGSSRGVEYGADGLMRMTEHPNRFFYDVTSLVPFHLWAPGQREEMDTHCNRWRPSIHMPRWASRITLEVVSVRVERLQEISEDDAVAEGCERSASSWWQGESKTLIAPDGVGAIVECGDGDKPCPPDLKNARRREFVVTAKESYAQLWDSINGSGSWAANPWVWVVEFKRVGAKSS